MDAMRRDNGITAFCTGMVSQITGVSRDRLTYWLMRGLLVPSIAGPDVEPPRRGVLGRRRGGIGRRYSVDDLVVALVIRELFASGISLERVQTAVAVLRRTYGNTPLSDALLVSGGRLVVLRRGDTYVHEGNPPWDAWNDRIQAVLSLSWIARTARELLEDWQRWRAAHRSWKRAPRLRSELVYADEPSPGLASPEVPPPERVRSAG